MAHEAGWVTRHPETEQTVAHYRITEAGFRAVACEELLPT
jgi:hypothetical protein